jgi:2,3-bisphosphoglycerate-dependent phosphoglycerate mutase
MTKLWRGCPQLMTMTRICLLRHGETAWNAEHRLQGQIDVDLNATGVAQAQAAGRWLRGSGVVALYSSDLARAWHTATSVGAALNLAPDPLPALRERRYGAFEGLTYDEAKARYPVEYRQYEARHADWRAPDGGESLLDVHARVTACLRELVVRHAGMCIAAVTHGGVLDIVNRFVRGNPLAQPRDFLIPNAGITWLTCDADVWRIDSWCDTHHLAVGALDELR